MGLDALLAQLVLALIAEGGPGLTRDAAELLVSSFGALVDLVQREVVPTTMVEYAFRIARGVIAGNPTATPDWQRDEVIDAIRILMQNEAVPWGDDAVMGVNALATLALVKAGFTGAPLPPPDDVKGHP